MFGDEPIFGQTELKIDSKGRIFIPANTKREPGEKLLIIYNNYIKYYEIYSADKLKDKYDEIESRLKNAKTKKERVFYEKMLCELSKSVLQSGQIDSQGRFFTGKTFKEYDKLLSTGAVDHLIIEPIKNKK